MYYYIVEQVFFVIFFARALAQFTTSNLVFHKLCSGDDGNHYLGKMCPNEEEAQKETTVLNTWMFVIGNLSFVLACTVGGYYSDLYKRRKPILWVPILGLLICGVANIAFVYFWHAVPGIVVAIFNGLMCLFGETNLLYTGGFCYVTDHSPEQSRSFRIGILLAAYYISTPIGRGLAGELNVKIGFINCYLISIGCYVISLVVVVFCLSELSQAKSAYYQDDKEKTNSIQRALMLYDRISISSNAKGEGNANPNGVHHSEDGETTVVQELDAKGLEGRKVPHKNANDNRETSLQPGGEGPSDDKAAITENTVSFSVETSNLTSSVTPMENRDFEEGQWKQTSKKSKPKKNRPYYDAYVEGKRPPLPSEIQTNSNEKASVFLAFYSLYESWKTLFKERSGSKTAILVIMVLTSPLYSAPMIVENSVFPLFVRQKFHWTEQMYGAFSAFKLSVIVVGMLFTIGFLGKVLKVPDAVIGAAASVVDTLACLGYILVTQSWQMFLVPICDMFHGSAQIAVSAVLSKQMDESERGKIFALKATMDSLIPVLLYPLYNGLYRETYSYFPEAFFLISAACAMPGIFAFSLVHYLQRDRTYMVNTKL